MNSLLKKLRVCDDALKAIIEDPELEKVLAEGEDGSGEWTLLRAAQRTTQQMRLSARFQTED